MADGKLILAVGALLAVGLIASLVANRLRIPGLILFLAIGMAIGSDGLGWINFDDYELARRIGIVSLALILFEGGLTTSFREIRPVLGAAVSLATVGTILTAILTGIAATALFDFSPLEGMLIGSIVAATDSAAIFSLLRESTLRRKLARTLEGESGFNDAMALILVIGFSAWIERPDYGVDNMLVLLLSECAVGLAVGLLVGFAAVKGFNRARLASPGLYPVASIATVTLAYGLSDTLHGSGFLSVYIAGLALGSAHIPAKQTVTAFHQGLAWVSQLGLFFTLGLLVFPTGLIDVAFEGTLLALATVFVARPVAVVIATTLGHYTLAERILLGWAGLRGAVPVVLATFPVIAGVPQSVEFFNIIFFAVLLSTLLQGVTFEPLARKLGLTTNQPALPRPIAETGTVRRLGAEVVEYPISTDDAIVGARVRDLSLPRDALVNVIVRGSQGIPPRGSTRLEAGDRLHILVRQENAQQVADLFTQWHHGPIGPPARPPLVLKGHAPVFHVRSWQASDGDPDYPVELAGLRVVERVRSRRDRPGALVVLEDSRFALYGSSVAVGGRNLMAQYARRQLRASSSDMERAWWEEVIGALAF